MLRNTLTLVGTNREPASHGEGAMRKMSVQAMLLSRAIRQRGCNVAILKVPAKLKLWEVCCVKPGVLHATFPMLVATGSSLQLRYCCAAVLCASPAPTIPYTAVYKSWPVGVSWPKRHRSQHQKSRQPKFAPVHSQIPHTGHGRKRPHVYPPGHSCVSNTSQHLAILISAGLVTQR